MVVKLNMRIGEKIIFSIILFLAVNSYSLSVIIGYPLLMMVAGVIFLAINIRPTFEKGITPRNSRLLNGINLLIHFMITTIMTAGYCVWLSATYIQTDAALFWINTVIVVLLENILFWNGIMHIYLSSVQLGIKWRIIGVFCGLIPIVNLVVLIKIIRITSAEVKFETEKFKQNITRLESCVCRTKYPFLMVHGVFFRDSCYFNYWGRIPDEMKKNGAVIYYGEHESASPVNESGEELSTRIKQIVEKTGCERVNVIAHSKGGLDCRYAISCAGADKYVASLTTVNTPHRGCFFADYLLEKIPDRVCNTIAKKYNNTLKHFGDKNPDFFASVKDLTAAACDEFNKTVANSPNVYYQSVGSKMVKAKSGKFPLNIAYPLVRHFGGDNDGLVSVESMRWGERFTFILPKAKRGISHADMIDLNRENIASFDVRELYVNIAKDLKNRGL